jgi:hypothetical protein
MACPFCDIDSLRDRVFYASDKWFAFLAAPYCRTRALYEAVNRRSTASGDHEKPSTRSGKAEKADRILSHVLSGGS